jgi:Ca-activated chloride channel family protein
MTVGPRYIPGAPAGKQGQGWSPDTTQVPDASRVTPKYAPPATRAGHDLSLELKLDAGVTVQNVASKTHEIDVERGNSHQANVRLRQRSVIPNKDFILRYGVAGNSVEDAVLTHRDPRGGFFTLILQPPQRVTAEDVTPKEIVFVLDTSGSMSGFPIEKAKESMNLALAGLYPRDTFNLITFAGDTHVLFPAPVPATPYNLQAAQQFLSSRRGGGGTEMMKAIQAAFAGMGDNGKVRIICFMTDGYVGNENQIIAEIQKHPQARVFSFGIGSSVNRYLLDKMAEEGRGEVEYVALTDNGSDAARRFHERVRNPLLTDIAIDWGGLSVDDVYPNRINDLFSAKPVILHGRYNKPGSGVIRLTGNMSGRRMTREIHVNFPANQPEHDTLATLWARSRVEELSSRDYMGMQQGMMKPEIQQEITDLGLRFRLMTPFTSFVAVEQTIVTRGGRPVTIEVPVEMPEGVSHEGVFGGEKKETAKAQRINGALYASSRNMQSGVVGGVVGWRGDQAATAAAPPPPPMAAPKVAEADYRMRDEARRAKLDSGLRQLAAQAGTRVRVEIWLTEATPQALAELKKLGFVEDGAPKVAKIRTGWIDSGKLEDLSKLTEVVSVVRKEKV